MSFGSFWREVGDFFEKLGAQFGGAFLVFIVAGAKAMLAGGGSFPGTGRRHRRGKAPARL